MTELINKIDNMSEKKFRRVIYCIIIIYTITRQLALRDHYNIGDNLMQYNTANAIANGMLPYKDINMVMTPLYFFITAFILKVHNSLIIKTIVDNIITMIAYCLLYEITNITCKKNSNKLIITNILLVFHICINCVPYNTLLIIYDISMILLQKNNKNINNKKAIILGILSAFAILTKQTVGSIIAITELIYICKTQKTKQKILFISSAFSLGLIFVSYLFITNSFNDFINYSILGLNSFGNNNLHINIILISIIIITEIYNIILLKKNTNKTIQQIIILNMESAIIAYPIIDISHTAYTITISLILILSNLLNTDKNDKQTLNAKKMALILTIITLLFRNINDASHVNNARNTRTKEIQTYTSNTQRIEKETQKHVIYISELAPNFDFERKEYNTPYTMFLNGNLGTKTPIEWIKDLEKQNVIIMMSKKIETDPKKEYTQFPTEVRSYIQKHWVKIDEYKLYDYYEYK